MTNFYFEMDKIKKKRESATIESVTVVNQGSIPQTITREVSYTKVTSNSLAETNANSWGVSTEFRMKIPHTPVFLGLQGRDGHKVYFFLEKPNSWYLSLTFPAVIIHIVALA